ncbi:MAG: beta-galactosidase, partial [Actinomycetota bacterium]|nr:beta-galactosidase [Actinomycetota bacterium]
MAWSEGVTGLCYGGDYNPEQWTKDVWHDDMTLMREAGVNLVTVGVFAWALIEREEGRYQFDWLDDVLDLLHGNAILVDLATGTASPPPWFSHKYPDTLPVTREGARLWPGARQAFCPSSEVYRAAAARLADALARRYAGHPALAMWHVHNEYGCHNAHCYCEVSAAAFRRWLQQRYNDLDRLNEAWGTAFWSQWYSEWEEINPPRLAPTFVNPTQQLDWWRFSSHELLECFRREREVLRRHTPEVPLTTNLMAAGFKPVDYWALAVDLDLIANDHYVRAEEPDNHVDVALAADVSRSLGRGAPWLLMEHATSAVNWQARNLAKLPGQMRRNSFQHVARGADGVMFFQWRASRAGAEKYHSAMVPHAGTNTKVWREVTQLGADLLKVAEIKGSGVQADVALLWDWEAWWAVELDAHPSGDLSYPATVREHHAALWRLGVITDLAHPASDLSRYRLVVVPSLYLVSDDSIANLYRFVEGGGTLLLQFFSGIVDENDHVRLGGYPGAFRDLLGIWVEEFFPLRQGESVELDNGASSWFWTERVHPDRDDTEIVASYVGGPVAGGPAITRSGRAWYVSTRLAPADLQQLLGALCGVAGAHPVRQVSPG